MTEYDSPWKEFLDFYLKAFLEFGFPNLHDHLEIQFRSDLETIEKEKQMPYITSV